MSRDRIVIKIGSNVLTKESGLLNISIIAQIVDQIIELKRQDIDIILITSGSMAAGRSKIPSPSNKDSVSQRQLWSAVGQVQLINRYSDLFQQYDISVAQILTTKDNFSDRSSYLNMRNCITTLLNDNIIPIINENDTVSMEEAMFTDNDELSGLVASMVTAESLIILSNINGVYNGKPSDPESSVIRTILADSYKEREYIFKDKSSLGRGGMQTKFDIAQKLAQEGIEVIIANGFTHNIITDIYNKTEEHSTRFVPNERSSTIKRWLSHSGDFAQGSITLNSGATDMLLDDSISGSILPVGIVEVSGDFINGDIISIEDQDKHILAIGKSSYESDDLEDIIGIRDQKVAVHYNDLYVIEEHIREEEKEKEEQN